MRFKIEEMLMAISYLTTSSKEGFSHICYPKNQRAYRGDDVFCFKNRPAAVEFAAENNFQYGGKLKPFLKHIDRIAQQTDLPKTININHYNHLLKKKNMNRNSLEDFRDYVKTLKIPAEMAAKAEEMMEKNLQYIQVTGQLPSRKGFMEATLHLKRTEQSDYYYLNKYDLAYSKAKPLEEGKQYLVMSTDADGKSQFKRFDSPIQAIENFRKREGNAELGIGKSVKDFQSVATMKDGKVDYVSKEFNLTYYSDPIKNTIYINQGKGFNMNQSSNMLMGGSAYRDDLVSRVGKQYGAWNEYQFDRPRDRYGNLPIRQYGEGYPFNLNTELNSYKIKELDDPKKLEQIISQIKDGERPVVSVTNDKGEELKMMAKAMPRYGNINFYNLSGQLEKREQFLKETKQEMGQQNVLDKKQNKQKSQGQEMSM